MRSEIEKILNPPNQEIQELIEKYDIDEEQAELVLELIDEEGMDERTAVRMVEEEY